MRRVVLSRLAEDDLDGVLEWMIERNPRAAERVLNQILATIRGLCDFSTGRPGRIAGTFEKVVVGLPYIVVYETRDDEPDGVVEILFVQHTSRDFPR